MPLFFPRKSIGMTESFQPPPGCGDNQTPAGTAHPPSQENPRAAATWICFGGALLCSWGGVSQKKFAPLSCNETGSAAQRIKCCFHQRGKGLELNVQWHTDCWIRENPKCVGPFSQLLGHSYRHEKQVTRSVQTDQNIK